MSKKLKTKKGFVALSVVLVVLAVVLTIGISTSLLTVNDLLSTDSGEKGLSTLSFVESCAEDSLIRINEDNSLPGTLTLPQGNCSVTINSQSGTDWDYTVEGTYNGFTKSIRLQVTRDTTVNVNSWIEP